MSERGRLAIKVAAVMALSFAAFLALGLALYPVMQFIGPLRWG